MNTYLSTTDSSEYLLVRYSAISELLFLSQEILDSKDAKELNDEIQDMIMAIVYYEECDISEFLIRQDSLLGKFILNPNRKRYLRCIDAFIDHDDIFNAFMFASISKNYDMMVSIKSLIDSHARGFIALLKEKFDYETLLYIYNSKSLKDFMFSNVEDSTKRYFVYEDKHISTMRSSKKYILHL